MAVVNAYATHPGKASEEAGKINEDFAHAWVKDNVYFQLIADGNSRTENLNPASFEANEVQRFVDCYSEPGLSVPELKRMISGAVHCANRVLLAYKKANGEVYNNSVFSTIDMTAIREDKSFITAHCGDGRTYLVRNQKIQQISKDHTEAQKLCDEGKITKEQIWQHADRDILTAALGFENPRIDIRTGKLQVNDIVMLLTDGAHKVLNLTQIHEILEQTGNCFDAVTGIVEAVNVMGGPDNVSTCVTYISAE